MAAASPRSAPAPTDLPPSNTNTTRKHFRNREVKGLYQTFTLKTKWLQQSVRKNGASWEEKHEGKS